MPPPPAAAFDFEPDSGDTPLAVQFTDQSLYSPTQWTWDFGDGDSSYARNPLHEYITSGIYYPRLLVSNAFGSDSITSFEPVIVTAPFTGVEVTCNATQETPSGVTDTIQYMVRNTADIPDTYNFNVVDSLGWFISPTFVQIYLGGATDTTINVEVIVPEGAENGTIDAVKGTATSQTNPQVFSSAVCRLIINNEAICGDVNLDNLVNISDAVYIINYVFSGGPAPCFRTNKHENALLI